MFDNNLLCITFSVKLVKVKNYRIRIILKFYRKLFKRKNTKLNSFTVTDPAWLGMLTLE